MDNKNHHREAEIATVGVNEEIPASTTEQAQTGRIRRLASSVIYGLSKRSYYLEKQIEVSSMCSCSGVCPTCVGATAAPAIATGLWHRFHSQEEDHLVDSIEAEQETVDL